MKQLLPSSILLVITHLNLFAQFEFVKIGEIRAINDLVHDRNRNRVWLANEEGLQFFDLNSTGQVSMLKAEKFSLAENFQFGIKKLAYDQSHGTIAAVNYNGDLILINKDARAKYYELSIESLTDLILVGGTAWVSSNQGIILVDGNGTETLDVFSVPALNDHQVNDLDLCPSGSVLVTTKSGLYRVDADNPRNWYLLSVGKYHKIRCGPRGIYFSKFPNSDDQLKIGSNRTADELPIESVDNMVGFNNWQWITGSNLRLWIQWESGYNTLWTLGPDNPKTKRQKGDFKPPYVTSILFANESNYWVGTEGDGLYILKWIKDESDVYLGKSIGKIVFESDESEITRSMSRLLVDLSDQLNKNKNWVIQLDGYAGRESILSPTILSKRRAESVRDELMKYGVGSDRIYIVPKGNPDGSNDRVTRRVDIRLIDFR